MNEHTRKRKAQSIDNSGFSPNSNAEGGRLVNKDGSINLKKRGRRFYERISMYHTFLRMPRSKFLLAVFLFYTVTNIFFAFLYLLIGPDSLSGTPGSTSLAQRYVQAFFFSSQTLTTVGYGHISPNGFLANSLAALESFIGIMSFALVTGLFYARFSRPKAYLIFSQNLLISPYKEGRALMFRAATFKNNHLSDVEAVVTTAFHQTENGQKVTRFYQLPLEIARINSLAISWTVVHAIDEKSPFWGYAEEDLRKADIEVIITLKAFDDHYSNMVQQRTSYSGNEMIYGAKFVPAYYRAENANHTVLDLEKIHQYEKAELPDIPS